jgi:hypothetical protein
VKLQVKPAITTRFAPNFTATSSLHHEWTMKNAQIDVANTLLRCVKKWWSTSTFAATFPSSVNKSLPEAANNFPPSTDNQPDESWPIFVNASSRRCPPGQFESCHEDRRKHARGRMKNIKQR